MVGTAVFGAPRFLAKTLEIQHFATKICKIGAPQNSRSYHHPSHPPLDALLISSWLTSKYSGRIISRNLSALHLASPPTTYVIITSENTGAIIFCKDFMCITSKYSRGINFAILAVEWYSQRIN